MRTAHNNERATQIRILRQLFFSPKGLPDWCLARNVITKPKQYGYTAPKGAQLPSPTSSKKIKLSSIWTTLKTVDDLANLLMSEELYKNPEAYAALCCGFESGIMRRMPQVEPQPLEKTLTCPAEAHFRMELWYAIQSPSYHHGLSAEWQKERQDNWTAAMQRVYNDRANNAAAAWERRCDDLNAEDASDDDDGNGENPPGDNDGDADIGSPSTKVNIDPKFWD